MALANVQPALGKALRAARERHRLSLQDVAAATAVSASFLSLVENGKSDITLGRLTRLVDFYGVSITELIPRRSGQEPDIVRANEATLLQSPSEGIEFSLLAPDTNRSMMPMLLRFEPAAKLAEPGRHRGEEWVHVLAGTLRLVVNGAEPQVLTGGDSAYYEADRPHRFENASDSTPLVLVCVDSPPPL